MSVNDGGGGRIGTQLRTTPDRRGIGSIAVLAALTAGLLLRLLFVFHFPHVVGDSLIYGDIARNLIEHHVYGFSEQVDGIAAAVHPTLIRLPGYPLFLATCFLTFGMQHYTAVMLVQMVLDLWTCLFLWGATARMFGEASGRAALWLAVLCPFTANYVAAPLTETLTLFCMAVTFYALIRWREELHRGRAMNRWVGVSGLAMAYAILLRPEQGLLAASVLPVMLWIGRREAHLGTWAAFRPVLLASFLILFPLVPWTARNWHTFHVFQPLAPRFANDPGEENPSGFQRWYRTWAIDYSSTETVYWNYDGAPLEFSDLPPRAFDSPQQRAATEALIEEYDEDNSATPPLNARFDALGRKRIGSHPMRYYLLLPLARVMNMAFRPRTENLPVPLDWWRAGGRRAERAVAWCFGTVNLLYFVLAGAALVDPRTWAQNSGMDRVVWVALLGTVLLRVAVLLTLDNSEPRYTLEFFPVLILFAGAAVARRFSTVPE